MCFYKISITFDLFNAHVYFNVIHCSAMFLAKYWNILKQRRTQIKNGFIMNNESTGFWKSKTLKFSAHILADTYPFKVTSKNRLIR